MRKETIRNLTRWLKHLDDTAPAPWKHVLYEQYTFWMLQQEKEELVDAYLTWIKLKLNMCEYAAEIHQELTFDKFVFGLTDDRL